MDKQSEYVEKLSAQIVEWDTQLDLLRFKADSASDDEKSEYAREVDALLYKRNEAALILQGISTTSDDTLQDLKAGTENTWNEVRKSVHDAILKTS